MKNLKRERKVKRARLRKIKKSLVASSRKARNLRAKKATTPLFLTAFPTLHSTKNSPSTLRLEEETQRLRKERNHQLKRTLTWV
jgi:hypothetical protein